MLLYLTLQHDDLLCNAIWGLKVQAHSTEVSWLALHVLWFLWIPWIFSQYYVLYLVKDLNSLQFCIAKCDFWFVWHFSWNLSQSDKPWSSFTCKDWDAPFIPKHDTLTNSLAYCELFQNSLTRIFYDLFTFILPLSQLFWNVLQPSKTKFVHITDSWFYCILQNVPTSLELGL